MNTKKSDLLPGDILIFASHDDNWLSHIIAVITNSNVSHAALVDDDTNYILEATLENAKRTLISDYAPRGAYVRRLAPRPDLSNVTKIGSEYIASDFPYGYCELVAVGIQIITKKIVNFLHKPDLIIYLVELATYALAKSLDRIKYDGRTAYICSELVFLCFSDAAQKYGHEYEIHMKNESETVYNLINLLLDYVSSHPETNQIATSCEDPILADLPSIQEIINLPEGNEFVKLMEEKTPITQEDISAFTPDIKFIQRVTGFCKLFLKATGYTAQPSATVSQILNDFLKVKAMFISPSDLLSNTTNLEDLGDFIYE